MEDDSCYDQGSSAFFRRNMIGLGLLLGVTGGVYFYTYNFLHRDNDFADVPVPPISEEELAQLKKEYEVLKANKEK